MGGKKTYFPFLLLFALVMGIHAQTASAQPLGLRAPQAPQKQQTNILSMQGGRYVFGQVTDSAKDLFMLDTMTGRLWRVSETGEVGVFLNPVPYRAKEGKYTFLPGEPPETMEKEMKKR